MDEIALDKLQYYTKWWFTRISLALAILMTIPTVAIMATWNTLPGQAAYPVKRYLEGIALKLVGNNFSVRADLQSQFVDQRFQEAEIMLTESSTAGLNDLVAQIQASKSEIIAAKAMTGTKQSVVAQEKSVKLATQLKEYNQKLETSKTNSYSGSAPKPTTPTSKSPLPSASVRANPSPPSFPSVPPIAPVLTQVPPVTVDPVTKAQEDIEKVIKELETPEAFKEESKSDDKDKGDKGKDNKDNKYDHKDDNGNDDKKDGKDK